MEILNIIEMRSGIIDNIISTIIPHKDDSPHVKVHEAEQTLLRLAKEHGADEDDEESILDNGYWENGKYEVHLIWSHTTIK